MSLRNRLLMRVKPYVYFFYYGYLSPQLGVQGLNKVEKRDMKVIISLTSYPARFATLHLTLETLLNQKKKPDKIILCIYEGEFDSLPDRVLRLRERGVEIKISHENHRSFDKLLPTLLEYKDSLIITCDDDVYYPDTFVEGLLEQHNVFPDSVVAYRCTYIEKNKRDEISPYINWKAKKTYKPCFNLFPTGVGGILYPPESLNKEVFNESIFLEICPHADDVWFKAMALLNRTKTVMVRGEYVEFPPVERNQESSLHSINVGEERNDTQIKAVFSKYNLNDILE